MKRHTFNWILAVLLCICSYACFEPYEFDQEDYPSIHSRWVGPEGRDIHFFNDFIFADDPDGPSTVLVNLNIPPQALGDTIFLKIIKGDDFSVSDLFTSPNPDMDTIIYPMYTGSLDSVLWQWRATVGFLPNLQVLSRTAQLSFAFEEPRMNRFPNMNFPSLPFYFHYDRPTLYKIEIHPEINPFIDSVTVIDYLMSKKKSWEEVDNYELDDEAHMVRLEIDNFHYLYFLAGERWTLQKDDALQLQLSGAYLGNVSIQNQGLVKDVQAGRTNNEAFNLLMQQSSQGFMFQNERSSYQYVGPFSGNPSGPFGPNINRIGVKFLFDGDQEGIYGGTRTACTLYWAIQTELGINLLDEYKSDDDLIIQVDTYGEVGDKVRGRITGRLRSQSFGSRYIDIDMPFDVIRTK